MEKHKVSFFRPYPFVEGQKIHIQSGPRSGDWEVVGINDIKVRLRCPVSLKEFDWNRFCYFLEERDDIEWPKKE